MSVLFHIDFPFPVAETHHRPGEHGALCAYQIPFAYTIEYRQPGSVQFCGIRQYYANSLLTVDLLETRSSTPLTLAVRPKRQPLYSLSAVLEGRFRFGSARHEESAPGSAYLARLGSQQYTVAAPSHMGRLISIAIHTAQLGVIGEDFAELATLLLGNPQSDDHYTPTVQADTLFMRRLIKLISPQGIRRRKDFNLHLQAYLPGLFSAFKGLLYGKSQAHYNLEKLNEVKAVISRFVSESHRAPRPVEVADAAYITPKKLERLIRSNFQCPPATYIQQQLMEAAAAYLTEHPGQPVYDIADTFGYSHTAAFSKAFTKYHGQSPAAYRAALLSKTDIR